MRGVSVLTLKESLQLLLLGRLGQVADEQRATLKKEACDTNSDQEADN